jgi:cobalt-zinc-cadmium efflux system membrane fusion protein
MRTTTSRRRAGGLASCLLAALGCETRAATPAPAQPPSGEVWLTRDQVREAHIEVEPVVVQPIGNEVVTSGKVTFDDLRVSHVYSPVTGRVTRILADPGQRVKKGAALATIESPDVGNAFADLAKADSDLTAAGHDFSRQQELSGIHAVSRKELETSEDNYRRAKAEMERSKRKVALFRNGTQPRAGGDDVDVSQGFTLRAPIDGEVISRNVNPGAEVQGQYGGGTAVELFTVGELDNVWILADVFEMDLGRVKQGAPVSIKVVAYPNKTFVGRVDYITGTLDPATRTARIRCSVPNPNRELKPEMYATVSIGVAGRPAPSLPRSAVLRVSDQTVVFVEAGTLSDGRLRFARRVVAVDETEGAGYVPVVRGVSTGEPVVSVGGVLLLGML